MKQVFKDSWAENFKFLPMFILWFGGYRWLDIERGRGSTGKELKTIVLHNVLIGITVSFYVSKMPCDWLNFSGFGWRFWMDLIHSVGEGNLENMTTVWPVSWTGAIRGSSPASPMLGMYPLSSWFLQWESFSRMQSLREQCVVDTIWMVYVPEPH